MRDVVVLGQTGAELDDEWRDVSPSIRRALDHDLLRARNASAQTHPTGFGIAACRNGNVKIKADRNTVQVGDTTLGHVFVEEMQMHGNAAFGQLWHGLKIGVQVKGNDPIRLILHAVLLRDRKAAGIPARPHRMAQPAFTRFAPEGFQQFRAAAQQPQPISHKPQPGSLRRQVPLLAFGGDERTPLPSPMKQVVRQRLDTQRGNIAMEREIAGTGKRHGRIAAFPPALVQIMLQRIKTRCGDIRILLLVVPGIEQPAFVQANVQSAISLCSQTCPPCNGAKQRFGQKTR